MRILSLDISSKTGFALHDNENLLEHGLIRVEIKDFNVNDDPNKQPAYPKNLKDAAREMADLLLVLIQRTNPQEIVIENTVKGKNRHTQRLLEWLHFAVIENIYSINRDFHYLDPSEWRSILEIRLSKEDKKNNRMVSKGKKRGRVTKKHLAVRTANELYGLKLKVKDNDMADAILLGRAFFERTKEPVVPEVEILDI
jgi:hypothetical protein